MLGANVPIVEIYLPQFAYNNKITYKTLLALGKFHQFIQPLKHGHDIKKPQQYLQVTNQSFKLWANFSQNYDVVKTMPS
jgi:hypothetical protein